LVRLRNDETVAWEENLGVINRKKHETKLSKDDVTAITQRLGLIDQGLRKPKMGRYATYVDTSVDLEIHLTTEKGTMDLRILNPWQSSEPRYGVKNRCPRQSEASHVKESAA